MLTNLNNLKDTLSGMDLQGLQDYARVNKNDPYIVSMALSMANTLKKMEVAKKGRAGMQPQPKVVDQQIAQMVAPPPQQMAAAPQQQMLPEDTGIGQLPAQNMQRMAEGGIVAFEEGGDVPGYAGPTGSFIDPLANYLKQIGMSAQEFISKNGNEQQQIRAAATANKPLVPPPAVPVAQAAQAAQAAKPPPAGTGAGLSRFLGPLAVATELFYPSNDAEKKASLPYKLGAQSAVDEQNTRVANAKESAEAYAARKIKEFEATLPAGQKLSPEARNKETDRLIAEKVAAELAVKRQPVDPTGQMPVDPIKSVSLKTDKGSANDYDPATATRRSMYVDGGGGGALPNAPSAEDNYMAGINKLAKSSQTASTMGPLTKLDAKRYSFTPAELAKIKPEDFAAALDAAMPKDQVASPFDTRQEALNKANVATRENAKAGLEKQFKEQGLAFEDTLNKLTSKEKRVQTMQDNQLGMSLLEAGLNMMAGESPYAMVNIGKGAQVGTKKYMEIQNQIESARDKIDDTKMKIEEFRRNEANMNARELRAAQRDIDDSVSAGAQSMINLAREQYGLNRQQAISFVSNSMQMQQFNISQKNQAEMQNQKTAADIDTAYANMANQRDIADKARSTQLGIAALEAKYRKDNPAAGSLGFFKALAPDGDPVKGMKLYSESLGPEGKGSEAILLDWQKKDPFQKQMARKLDPIGSAVLDRQLQERVLQGSISDKPAGAVLDKQ
jgi:hypothetical protein